METSRPWLECLDFVDVWLNSDDKEYEIMWTAVKSLLWFQSYLFFSIKDARQTRFINRRCLWITKGLLWGIYDSMTANNMKNNNENGDRSQWWSTVDFLWSIVIFANVKLQLFLEFIKQKAQSKYCLMLEARTFEIFNVIFYGVNTHSEHFRDPLRAYFVEII